APWAKAGAEPAPTVIPGGPAVSGNPEPVALMLDAIVVGEVEPVMDGLQDIFLGGGTRGEHIDKLARLPGVYVPSHYRIGYAETGTIQSVEPSSSDIALPV